MFEDDSRVEPTSNDGLINDDMLWILKMIRDNDGIGRRGLCQIAERAELGFGESKIRRLLKTMSELDLIQINKGAKGSTLTDKGKDIIGMG